MCALYCKVQHSCVMKFCGFVDKGVINLYEHLQRWILCICLPLFLAIYSVVYEGCEQFQCYKGKKCNI